MTIDQLHAGWDFAVLLLSDIDFIFTKLQFSSFEHKHPSSLIRHYRDLKSWRGEFSGVI